MREPPGTLGSQLAAADVPLAEMLQGLEGGGARRGAGPAGAAVSQLRAGCPGGVVGAHPHGPGPLAAAGGGGSGGARERPRAPLRARRRWSAHPGGALQQVLVLR